jgi:hypothetical protein
MRDDVLRMRTTLVSDETLANLRAIGREIGLMPQKAKPHIQEVNTGFAKLTETMKKFGEQTLRAVPALEEWGLGAAGAGVAAGVLMNTLSNMSKRMVELKYRSVELGMSERDIRAWASTAEKAGVSAQAMMQGLGGFKNVTEGLKYNLGGVRDQLYSLGAGPVVRAIQAATSQADKLKVAFTFKDVLWKESPWKAEQFFETIGLGASAARLSLEEYEKTQAKLAERSPQDQAKAQRFTNALVDMGEAWEHLSTSLGIAVFPGVTELMELTTGLIENFQKLERVSEWAHGGPKAQARGAALSKRLLKPGVTDEMRAPDWGRLIPEGLRIGPSLLRDPSGKNRSFMDWLMPSAHAEEAPWLARPPKKGQPSDAIRPVGSDAAWLKAVGAASFGLTPTLSALARDVGTSEILHVPERTGAAGLPVIPPPVPPTVQELNRMRDEQRRRGRTSSIQLPEGSYQVAGPAFAPTPGGPGASRTETEDTIKDGVYAALVEFESYASAGGGGPGGPGGGPGAGGGSIPGGGGGPGAGGGSIPDGGSGGGLGAGSGSGSGGGGGGLGAGSGGRGGINIPGGGGGGGTSGPGGPAALSDETGKPIDPDTMKEVESLGRSGDVAGLQKLFAQKGYHMSGPACGIVASKYVRSTGFQPPKSGAVGAAWHGWGEAMKPEDINAPGHPFGSMVGTYFHGRYQGKEGKLLGPEETGGHVMNIVPGTYDPKTGTAMFADQYGVRRRPLADIDERFAGASAVAAAAARRGEKIGPGAVAPAGPTGAGGSAGDRAAGGGRRSATTSSSGRVSTRILSRM